MGVYWIIIGFTVAYRALLSHCFKCMILSLHCLPCACFIAMGKFPEYRLFWKFYTAFGFDIKLVICYTLNYQVHWHSGCFCRSALEEDRYRCCVKKPQNNNKDIPFAGFVFVEFKLCQRFTDNSLQELTTNHMIIMGVTDKRKGLLLLIEWSAPPWTGSCSQGGLG